MLFLYDILIRNIYFYFNYKNNLRKKINFDKNTLFKYKNFVKNINCI